MLSFLKREQKPERIIRRTPNLLFGMSVDTPQQFHMESTMFSPYTFKTNRLLFESPYSRKTDLSQIEEDKILSLRTDRLNRKTKYISSYYEEYGRNNTRFRRIKGQFTTTIDSKTTLKLKESSHRRKRSLWGGTIMRDGSILQRQFEKMDKMYKEDQMCCDIKRERSLSKMMRDKSCEFDQKSSFGLLMKDKSGEQLRSKSNFKSKNMKPLDQYQIHKERLSLRDSFYATIQERKKTKRYCFALPIIVPENANSPQ